MFLHINFLVPWVALLCTFLIERRFEKKYNKLDCCGRAGTCELVSRGAVETNTFCSRVFMRFIG